jgi:uncharacterized protein
MMRSKYGRLVTDSPDPALTLTDRMRAGLRDAMRARDEVAVRTLRTALGAIANAEAPPIDSVPAPRTEPVVGQLVEHPRLVLSDDEVTEVLRGEIADRHDTIAQYRRAGRDAPAAELEGQIAVLERYL